MSKLDPAVSIEKDRRQRTSLRVAHAGLRNMTMPSLPTSCWPEEASGSRAGGKRPPVSVSVSASLC